MNSQKARVEDYVSESTASISSKSKSDSTTNQKTKKDAVFRSPPPDYSQTNYMWDLNRPGYYNGSGSGYGLGGTADQYYGVEKGGGGGGREEDGPLSPIDDVPLIPVGDVTFVPMNDVESHREQYPPNPEKAHKTRTRSDINSTKTKSTSRTSSPVQPRTRLESSKDRRRAHLATLRQSQLVDALVLTQYESAKYKKALHKVQLRGALEGERRRATSTSSHSIARPLPPQAEGKSRTDTNATLTAFLTQWTDRKSVV